MQTIRLPMRIDTHNIADLHILNQQLRQGEVRLDWSDVEPGIAPEALHALLVGLSLADAIDDIGGDTIPEALFPEIQAAFLHNEAGDDASAPLLSVAETDEPKIPALWVPERPMSDPTLVLDEHVSGGDMGSGERGNVTESVPMNESEQEHAPETLAEGVVQERKGAYVQPTPVLEAPPPAQLRDQLEEMVLRDLLGPAGGAEEELSADVARVRDRYLIGMLAPHMLQTLPEEQDELGIAEESPLNDETVDVGVAQKASLNPASLGMSFSVDKDATDLLVTVHWGQYQRRDSQTQMKKTGSPEKIWKRVPRGGEPKRIPLRVGPIQLWRPEENEQPDVIVRGLVRDSGGSWTVTLFLVNGQQEPKQLRDTAWLFQPEMIVEAPDAAPIFRRRETGQQKHYTNEEKSMAMLYRRNVSFAIGHGIGIHAETLPDDSTCAVRLSTRVAPQYDVPATIAPTAHEVPALAPLVLDMKTLAEVGQEEAEQFAAFLEPLTVAYSIWIAQQEQKLHDPAAGLADYQDVAQDTLAHCRRTLERMQQGIDLLRQSRDAQHAFTFMNRAMWHQRIHTLHAEEQRKGKSVSLEDIDQPHNRSWRPFQLAFILLNLPSLTDLHHADRRKDADALADLLWFPTGGGKTEAYLGLTAYTLAIRRLQGIVEGRSGMDGVAVIMRYTLRLLTLQQFQRASSLICACEVIRRGDNATWGQTPFRLGLWVGQRSTPNTTQESAEAITQQHGLHMSMFGGGSPHQLTNCPWCGAVIDGGSNIIVNKHKGRTYIYCSDPYGQCPFSKAKSPDEGLPVLVVDEEIYRLLPALLIATVDKFAQLPWKGATQMLFGQVDKYCDRHGFRSPDLEDSDSHPKIGNLPRANSTPHAPLRPPDLIIQDELHLIAGPLGTLVGLYETVVDSLCTWTVDGQAVRPKVIAATATIRRASQQVQALFLRQVNIFPPQGLDVKDNFFSLQREPSEQNPGRRYLGICANGRRLKAALIRVYAAYLAAAQALYDRYGSAADPWMTLVGYFNSMSELGGTRRLVEDDISSRLRRMDQRGLAKRRYLNVDELTSRKSSSQIPGVLSRLESGFGTENPVKPLDVLLATNMISVGVDVKRLGLMVVTGQPKTTAEYIQATSRVGRSHPGLVCVVFNWARPRDLSHYEQFEHYHATFYQQVEALSVTPFAPRALDRGLAALLTSYVRLSTTELSANGAGGGGGGVGGGGGGGGGVEERGMVPLRMRSRRLPSEPRWSQTTRKRLSGCGLL
ncbi:MAG: DISARM system helicase DrmA [Ktedonobacteraceae bacterium]